MACSSLRAKRPLRFERTPEATGPGCGATQLCILFFYALLVCLTIGIAGAAWPSAPCVHARNDPQAAPQPLQGANGAKYGSTVRLDTQIDALTISTHCVAAEGDSVRGTCAPLGGYSVWASMPPQANSSDATRKQVMVLSHWDSQGLFRSIISVRIPSSYCHGCSLCALCVRPLPACSLLAHHDS